MNDFSPIGDILAEVSPARAGDSSPSSSGDLPPAVWETDPCPRSCHGAGYVLPAAYRTGDVIPDAPDPVPCPACERGADILRRRGERLVGASGLAKQRDMTFAAFAPRPGLDHAWQAAMAFAAAPAPIPWLLLLGPPGVGKTTLALCIGNERLDRGQPALFLTTAKLLRRLAATFRQGSEATFDERFDAIREAQFLILDDYGAHQVTDWAATQLYELLNDRWMERRPTVITTNLGLGDIEPRLRSRLSDSRICQTFELRPARPTTLSLIPDSPAPGDRR